MVRSTQKTKQASTSHKKRLIHCFEVPHSINNPMRTKAQRTNDIGLSYVPLLNSLIQKKFCK